MMSAAVRASAFSIKLYLLCSSMENSKLLAVFSTHITLSVSVHDICKGGWVRGLGIRGVMERGSGSEMDYHGPIFTLSFICSQGANYLGRLRH